MISKEKFRNIKPGDMVKIDSNIDKVNALETKYEGAPIYGMVEDMIPHNKGHWAKVKKVLDRYEGLTLEPIDDTTDGAAIVDYIYTRYCILEVVKAAEKDLTVNEAWDKISEDIHKFIVKYFPDKPCMLIADYPNGGTAKEGGAIKIMTDME